MITMRLVLLELVRFRKNVPIVQFCLLNNVNATHPGGFAGRGGRGGGRGGRGGGRGGSINGCRLTGTLAWLPK